MSGGASATPYHPKWYRPRVSVWWWLKTWPYFRWVLRELTSVFVACFAAISLWQVRALGEGPEAYARFAARLETPFFITLNSVALLFVLFHAITWFNLAPTAIVVRLGGKRVPNGVITSSNYLAWAVLSGIVARILIGE